MTALDLVFATLVAAALCAALYHGVRALADAWGKDAQ